MGPHTMGGFLLAGVTVLALIQVSGLQFPTRTVQAKNQAASIGTARAAFLNTPLSFEANRGQSDPQVKFLSRGAGYTLLLTGDGAVLALQGRSQESEVRSQNGSRQSSVVSFQSRQKDHNHIGNPGTQTPRIEPRPAILRLRFLGANTAEQVAGLNELPGKSNYFIGNDPKKWRTQVPNYAKVKYENVYPGIDLVYYGTQRQLEYDFVVAPGADPKSIAFDIVGADGTGVAASSPRHAARRGVEPPLRIAPDGDLVISTESGDVRFHKPVVYQPDLSHPRSEDASFVNLQSSIENRQSVDGRFILLAQNRVGFEVGNYDATRPLIIDPVLSYSTYLGGSSGDYAFGIAVDSFGSAYVTGQTYSADFPLAAPLDNTCGTDGTCNQPSGSFATSDAFVTKFDPSGASLVYSTYFGGSSSDAGYAIAVDSFGNAYFSGTTFSSDFPTAHAFQSALGGSGDAFLTELDATGSVILYSTYLGGSDEDDGFGVALDSNNNAYVAGFVDSANFPTTSGAFKTALGGMTDAFVAKLNPQLTGSASLVYSTYLGGSSSDGARSVAVDSAGSALVTGFTYSTNFPTSTGAFQTSLGGGSASGADDVFVTKLSADGSKLTFSTYLGGAYYDEAHAVAVDSSLNAYVTGLTYSIDFPTRSAFQAARANSSDAFVSKFDPTGQLLYSTYLGGSDVDSGNGIAVDTSGNIFVAGETHSTNFPLANTMQLQWGGGDCGAYYYYSFPCSDAFILELNAAGSSLVYSSFLGATDDDAANGVAIDPLGNAYIAGRTATLNRDFPITPGAFQTGFAASADHIFVAKISPADAPGLASSPAALNFGNQSTASESGVQSVVISDAGSATLTFTSIAIGGANASDFVLGTNACSGSISGGSKCALGVSFKPATIGPKIAALIITDNAAGSPQSIPLSGTGIPAAPVVTLSTTYHDFGSVLLGTTSGPIQVVLTNTGDAALNISSFAITGDSSFAITGGSCATGPLAPAGYCNVSVTFAPTAIGLRSGSLTITDDASDSPQQVSLNGTGAAVTLTPSTLDFGSMVVGVSADPRTVTLANSTGSALNITGIAFAGANSGDFSQTNTCGASVAAGGNCSITVTFKPTAPGTRTATLTVTDDAADSPQTASLSGTGMDYALSTDVNSRTVTAGQTTTFLLTTIPLGGFNRAVSLTCSGQPVRTGCSISPSSVTLDGTNLATATVMVATTASTLAPPRMPILSPPSRWPVYIWLGMLGLFGLALYARLGWRGASRARPLTRRLTLLIPLAMLLGLALWASCGGGGTVTHIPGTPPGTYTLTLTGTSGVLSHSTTVSLTVQ